MVGLVGWLIVSWLALWVVSPLFSVVDTFSDWSIYVTMFTEKRVKIELRSRLAGLGHRLTSSNTDWLMVIGRATTGRSSPNDKVPADYSVSSPSRAGIHQV